MKATVKPHLYTRRTKLDGKYPVKLRVRFQREKRFYSLGIDMTEKEFSVYHLDKKLKKVFDDISYYQKKAEDVIHELKENFSWELFEKGFLKKATASPVSLTNSNTIQVLPAILKYVKSLKEDGKISSSKAYNHTHNQLASFIGKGSLSFQELDSTVLNNFDKYLRKNGLSNSTIGIFMRNIRSIYNIAIKDKLVSSDSYPFGRNKYSPPASRVTKKSLTVEEVGKIFSYIPETETEGWAKDMWMFAYFANGLNLKDIALLKYKNIVKDEIHFVREKSKNSTRDGQRTVQVVITEELNEIIKKWGGRPKKPEGFIFDILSLEKQSPEEIYRDVHKANKLVNKYMKRIGIKLGLDKNPTTNFARHSFATVLKRAGVGIEMISEQLGHSNIRTTEIYLGSFEKEQRKEVTKHLSAFKNTIVTQEEI